MTERENDESLREIAASLMSYYSFDLDRYSLARLVDHWRQYYPSDWIQMAVVEALYQGRYKAISVEQILALWYKRGQPLYHFNREFERMVCSQFGDSVGSSERQEIDKPREIKAYKPGRELVNFHSEDLRSIPLPVGLKKPSQSASSDQSPLTAELSFSAVQSDAEPNTKPDERPDSKSEVLLSVTGPQGKDHDVGDRPISSPSSDKGEHQSIQSIQTFQPNHTLEPDSKLSSRDRSRVGQSPSPIHQFVPEASTNRLHTKLKAVLTHCEGSDLPPRPPDLSSATPSSAASTHVLLTHESEPDEQ
jgi:predicted lipoprotein with Yx(FWY)xxD motif